MTLPLDGEGHLHEQAYRALRAAILRGNWPAGARLPSSRSLASDLQLSRNTLLAALEQLQAEGYVEAIARSGSYVVDNLPVASLPAGPRPLPRERPLQLSAAARALESFGTSSWELARHARVIDFRYGEPAYSDVPLESWARLLSAHVRRARTRDLSYRAPGGHPALREALARYVARARGVRCEPEQVIVTSGSQQAIDLCARVVLDPDDRVGLEDPGY